jgi:hypothetical protein
MCPGSEVCVRAMFTTLPGYGHPHPLLPNARVWRDAGHEVLFASAAVFAPAIQAHDFGCLPIGRRHHRRRQAGGDPGRRGDRRQSRHRRHVPLTMAVTVIAAS